VSIVALYVYSQTTFKTDTRIESMAGHTYDPGVVTLPRGLYRLASAANIEVMQRAPGPGYIAPDIVPHDVVVQPNGTKTIWPDPPAEAAKRLGLSGSEIGAFVQAAGAVASEID
jgi:hypothetical protein